MTMKFSNSGGAQDTANPSALIQRPGREKAGFLDPWYRLSAPPEPPIEADLAAREAFRRGRLTSVVLLFFLVLAVIFIPVAIFGASKFLLPLMLIVLVVIVIAVLFNRAGKISIAGAILVASVEIAFMISLSTERQGLGVYNLPTLDMLVLPELLAVSLLPGASVFFVALLNCLFIWFALDTTLIHHQAGLQTMMGGQSGYGVLVRPIIIQVLVAIVTFLWVRSTQRAIARADRAEVIAQLEHAIAQQEHTIAQEKRQLESSIQQIVQAHTQISNGDYNVRIPLTQENVLWQVAGSLNNLLSRLQRYRQESQQYQHMSTEINQLTTEVRRARASRQPLRYRRSGTPLDALVLELTSPVSSSSSATSTEGRSRSGPLSGDFPRPSQYSPEPSRYRPE
jgi:large-conductance mechanosensitive channel